ncbi:hypothetical protein ANCDUO_17246 [Ancylostoma duodenale]|uniref:Myosin tail domain-containing protein n=1 Tax=Ancylostoma duodenale TaxID=51022 RepID=A0A0C2FVS2_9BILA|nr:hypothetical protein ANCDUO_17246 [Ancylostoma duodenale]
MLDKVDETSVLQDIMRRKEDEVRDLKAREELEHISRAREDEEQLVSNLNRKVGALEEQLHELNDQVQISLTFQEETRLKLAQINRVRQLEEEKATIAEERDEIDAARQHMERQLTEARKKADEGVIQQMEELRKKAQRDLENTQHQLEESEASKERLVQSKKKLQQEAILERDAHAQESRDRETRILSLVNELEQLKGAIDETERVRRMLQLELDESVSS